MIHTIANTITSIFIRLLNMPFYSLPVISVLAIGVSTSCTRKTDDIEIQIANGDKIRISANETLRINIASEPPTLDWNKANDIVSTNLAVNLMEGLVQYDTTSSEPKLLPALATKWESTNNGKIWKFSLRQNVKWSDGIPFSGQQIADSWQRALSRDTTGGVTHFLFAIKNAHAFNAGKADWKEVGVRIPSPQELEVELERPMSFFPYLLTSPPTFPIRKDLIDKLQSKWTNPGQLITLGPFVLKSWEHDKLIVLEKNENYYGEKPKIKFVLGYMVPEVTTAFNLYEAGKLDAIHGLPSVEMKKLRLRKDFQSVDLLKSYYFGFNTIKSPTDNVLVRRAIAHAINREEIVKMLNGGEHATSSWIPKGVLGFNSNIGLKFDPEKSRLLLENAGYGKTKKFPKVELKFNTNEEHQRIAEAVQAQLKKNLGIEVELKTEEWKVYLSSTITNPPPIYRLSFVPDYSDPDDFMNLMTSDSDNNRTRWKNKEYDSLVHAGAATSNLEERLRIYNQAQRLMLEEDAIMVPMFTLVSHFLLSDRVEGYPKNSFEILNYKTVILKPLAK